jgi:pantoate--beta-alanine ligase
MSSRNSYLSESERLAASCLSRGLFLAQDAFLKGERRAEVLTRIVREQVEAEPKANMQYISCADPKTLEELDGEVISCLISMAVLIGKTRLIDNIQLGVVE